MPELIREETVCCGSKRCPTVKLFDDGTAEISDNDPEIGSVGKIKIQSHEAAKRIAAILIGEK